MGLLIVFIVGLVIGIPVFFIGLFFRNLFKNTKERRNIKRMLKQGKFLVTIDPKDYDTKAWQNQKYGNIDVNAGKEELKTLNQRIFKKSLESTDDNFMVKIMEYVKIARKHGFTDQQITEEFKKKSYTEDLIEKIFQDAR